MGNKAENNYFMTILEDYTKFKEPQKIQIYRETSTKVTLRDFI